MKKFIIIFFFLILLAALYLYLNISSDFTMNMNGHFDSFSEENGVIETWSGESEDTRYFYYSISDGKLLFESRELWTKISSNKSYVIERKGYLITVINLSTNKVIFERDIYSFFNSNDISRNENYFLFQENNCIYGEIFIWLEIK